MIASPVVPSLAFSEPQWRQIYNPTGHLWLSSLLAALPLIVLLVAVVVLRWKAHFSALLASATCILVAIGLFHMPASLGLLSALLGFGPALCGFNVFGVLFLDQLVVGFELIDGHAKG